MRPVERVRAALNHQEPDRVPKGEFRIGKGLAAAILGKDCPLSLSDYIQVLRLLEMDFVALEPKTILPLPSDDGIRKDVWGRKVKICEGREVIVEPAITSTEEASRYRLPPLDIFTWEEVKTWRNETNFFTFGLLEGPFQGMARLLDFTAFLVAIAKRESFIVPLAEKIAAFNMALGKRFLEAGGHGIIIADDLAYNQGTYISPAALRELFFPSLKEEIKAFKAEGAPVFFHGDGNIEAILPDLVSLGFDGVHPLQPSAGMDISRVKAEYGSKLCLMGNFDMDFLKFGFNTQKLEQEIQRLINAAAAGGGYIFSSSTGILDDDLPPDRVLSLYRIVSFFGTYPLICAR